MTGCLLLGLSDEKVTKVHETPTGPKEKRIPTSFIDDTRIMLTLRFFIFKYSLRSVQRMGNTVSAKDSQRSLSSLGLRIFFAVIILIFVFQFNKNFTNVFCSEHKNKIFTKRIVKIYIFTKMYKII